MDCLQCGSYVMSADNYCRNCGIHLKPARLPVVVTPRRDVTSYGAAKPVVWKSVGILAGTLLIEIVRRRMLQSNRWMEIPLALLSQRAGKSLVPSGNTSRQGAPKNGEIEMRETIVFVERKVRR